MSGTATAFPTRCDPGRMGPDGGEDLLAQAVNTFRELDDQWGLAFGR